jgi:hypothetical protein
MVKRNIRKKSHFHLIKNHIKEIGKLEHLVEKAYTNRNQNMQRKNHFGNTTLNLIKIFFSFIK